MKNVLWKVEMRQALVHIKLQPFLLILFSLNLCTQRDAALDKVGCSDELRCNGVTTKLVVTPARIASSNQLC